jgi:hypothetical protein
MVPGVWGSQISRQPAHEGSKVVSRTHRPPLPPRNHSWYSFLLEGHSAARRVMSMKNSNDNIRDRTRDFPTCSVMPQPTAPTRTLIEVGGSKIIRNVSKFQVDYKASHLRQQSFWTNNETSYPCHQKKGQFSKVNIPCLDITSISSSDFLLFSVV